MNTVDKKIVTGCIDNGGKKTFKETVLESTLGKLTSPKNKVYSIHLSSDDKKDNTPLTKQKNSLSLEF